MKQLHSYKTITVFCSCGLELVKYKKGPGRTLVKIHRDRIAKDYHNLFGDTHAPEGTEVYCPECRKRLATVRIVSGKYVYKVNRGSIGLIRKS